MYNTKKNKRKNVKIKELIYMENIIKKCIILKKIKEKIEIM
tara:strand:+ start:345 stop:467 length:123 start_codon:yes stop_codon:yes gene_type:complete